MNSIDQQFIEYIVKSLVSNPDAVKVERRIDEKGVLLELTVDPEDLGRVIGKRGATAQSLRTLLRALGTKNDARYNLKIVDNGVPPAARTTSSDDDDVTDQAGQSVREEQAQAAEGERSMTEGSQEPPTESEYETSMPVSNEEDHSDVVTKTRKELEELDDLDV